MMDFRSAKNKVFGDFGLGDKVSGVFWGDWAPANGKKMLKSISPINGETLAEVAMAADEDYERVIIAAQKAYAEWAEIPAPRRGDIIRQCADELAKHKESLGLLVTLEVGKTLSEGQGEVQEMVDIGYFATGLSRQIYGLTIASERADHRMYEQWQPIGVVGVISAFNFPVAVWSWNSFIAAVAGDTVVWKPSSDAPLVAVVTIKIMNRVFERNGLKPIFFLLVGSGKTVGDKMNSDSRMPLISFTGSVPTGRRISEIVGRRLGRSLLELGGNNGAVISDKCDMTLALKGVTFGALATAGQRCTSTRRIIVHSRIYDEFVRKLVSTYGTVRVGDPLEKDTLVGPLINEAAVKDYIHAIKSAMEQGGKILFGGNIAKVGGFEGGYYVQPTLIEANPDMPIVKEETFAPIEYVMKYSTIEDALKIHNAVPQGLSSSIFTNDIREEEYFLSWKGSDCGIANVNTGTAGAEIGGAFGGEKETGGGRESGSDSWKIYARRQTVTINYGKDLPLAQGVTFLD
jgi:aldehyde dehydrogenase (NAD+)